MCLSAIPTSSFPGSAPLYLCCSTTGTCGNNYTAGWVTLTNDQALSRRRTRAKLGSPFSPRQFFSASVNALLLPCEWVGGTSLIRALKSAPSPPFALNIHSCESCQSTTSSDNSRRQRGETRGSCPSDTVKVGFCMKITVKFQFLESPVIKVQFEFESV